MTTPPVLRSTGFKPTQPWPWHQARFAALDAVRSFELQPGDIAVRRGNAVMRHSISFGPEIREFAARILEFMSLVGPADTYIELPFSPLIAKATGSLYSHAALVYSGNPDPVLLDVGGEGTKVLEFLDWLDDVRGEQIEFLRYAGPPGDPNVTIVDAMNDIRERDPDFDSDFAPGVAKLYCVEAVYEAYNQLDIDLGPPTPFNELPDWSGWLDLFATLAGIKPDTPIFFVGNDKQGLMASPLLERLGGLRLVGDAVEKF